MKVDVSPFDAFRDCKLASQVTRQLAEGTRVSDLHDALSAHGQVNWPGFREGLWRRPASAREKRISPRCGSAAGRWSNGAAATGGRSLCLSGYFTLVVGTATTRIDPAQKSHWSMTTCLKNGGRWRNEAAD
jgi:hypothetical protein